MECPKCRSIQIQKNGHRKGIQCYKCKRCGRQFLEYSRKWRYSEEIKQLCLKMYFKGMGVREIERMTDIHHTTVMSWIRDSKNHVFAALDE